MARLIQAVMNSAPINTDVHVEISSPESSTAGTPTSTTRTAANDVETGKFFFLLQDKMGLIVYGCVSRDW